ncbi:hypothetical protein HWB92_gp118 [Serratia phage vB_SmaA_3M]|uniref:Uncharacterized protein n=1 Tax=Serratia phage vB_SmaA_3M TaxID=2419930 RepID=A0A3G2YS84_9CAUD|nr:hypothetical protein HWB92_gp118 [Serratia phage vB_SmaA_3M]AYP28376.1 hypothetical protein 3M_120 [Serratia phage vB_SmaA_3M]
MKKKTEAQRYWDEVGKVILSRGKPSPGDVTYKPGMTTEELIKTLRGK